MTATMTTRYLRYSRISVIISVYEDDCKKIIRHQSPIVGFFGAERIGSCRASFPGKISAQY